MTRGVFSKFVNACIWGWSSTTLVTTRLGRRHKAPSLNSARHRPWFKTAQLDAVWGVLYAAIIPDTASGPDHVEPASPPRTQREEFFIGDTVGFTDKHLSERVGTIVRLNAKTASIAVNDSDGHCRVSYALLRKIIDI
jgi:hypothetical protein